MSVFENGYRLHAEQRDVEYDENSEADTEETDEETETIEDDLINNLFLREQVGGGNGLIKRDIAVREHTILNQTHEAEDSFKPQTQGTSSVAQKSSARHVSFANEGTLKTNVDSDSDSSMESLRIEFQHTPIDSQAQEIRESDAHPIQTPADIHKHIKEMMSKDGTPKPILKNKSADFGSSSSDIGQRMQWLRQSDSVPIITQEMEEPVWNTATLQPAQLEERPVVIT
jgi:hypothetical protein